ncbi:hypothetical protein KUCAC02_009188, partial [Chaenocephalus aceratus]
CAGLTTNILIVFTLMCTCGAAEASLLCCSPGITHKEGGANLRARPPPTDCSIPT